MEVLAIFLREAKAMEATSSEAMEQKGVRTKEI